MHCKNVLTELAISRTESRTVAGATVNHPCVLLKIQIHSRVKTFYLIKHNAP